MKLWNTVSERWSTSKCGSPGCFGGQFTWSFLCLSGVHETYAASKCGSKSPWISFQQTQKHAKTCLKVWLFYSFLVMNAGMFGPRAVRNMSTLHFLCLTFRWVKSFGIVSWCWHFAGDRDNPMDFLIERRDPEKPVLCEMTNNKFSAWSVELTMVMKQSARFLQMSMGIDVFGLHSP